MAKIKTEKQYEAACARIDELDLISDLVADYEEEHFLVEAPALKVAREISKKLNINEFYLCLI